MMTFLYVLLAIAVLLLMVLIHEFGHYIAGKILKFKITEFSIGFGFPIFSHTSKKTGEKFSIRIFPLGGYCAFEGEDDTDESKSSTAFNNQKPWKRIIVFLAGVTANFLTAILFSWILLSTVGYDVPQITKNVTYNENVFIQGDVITHIDGEKIDFAFGVNYVDAVQSNCQKAKEYYTAEDYDGGEYSFEMTVKRDGTVEKLNVVVYKVVDSEGIYFLTGLESAKGESPVTKAYVYNAWEGFCRSFEMAFGWVWAVLKSLWQLITFQLDFTQFGGTISSIAYMAEMSTNYDASVFLIFVPVIAANLATINLLPFPSLDGSHVLVTIIEWIRKKPINRKVENIINVVGISVLLAFVVIADVVNLILRYLVK